MSAMNGSKSKTSSSKSSTEGGPAPQRFDVAAMVSLAARCRGAGWRHPHASAAVCTASVHASAAVGARAARRWSLARRSRGGGESGALAVSARGGGGAAVVPGG